MGWAGLLLFIGSWVRALGGGMTGLGWAGLVCGFVGSWVALGFVWVSFPRATSVGFSFSKLTARAGMSVPVGDLHPIYHSSFPHRSGPRIHLPSGIPHPGRAATPPPHRITVGKWGWPVRRGCARGARNGSTTSPARGASIYHRQL